MNESATSQPSGFVCGVAARGIVLNTSSRNIVRCSCHASVPRVQALTPGTTELVLRRPNEPPHYERSQGGGDRSGNSQAQQGAGDRGNHGGLAQIQRVQHRFSGLLVVAHVSADYAVKLPVPAIQYPPAQSFEVIKSSHGLSLVPRFEVDVVNERRILFDRPLAHSDKQLECDVVFFPAEPLSGLNNSIHVRLRIPAMPITHSDLMAITIPSDADHRRSEATLGCSYHAEVIGIRQAFCC